MKEWTKQNIEIKFEFSKSMFISANIYEDTIMIWKQILNM